MFVGLVDVTTGPEPPQAPQAKDPGFRGARPSSARNWCSFLAKLPMAEERERGSPPPPSRRRVPSAPVRRGGDRGGVGEAVAVAGRR